MGQRSIKKSAEKTRRFVFTALHRQRVVVLTQNDTFFTIQKGVRFGNLNAQVEKEMPNSKLVKTEIDDEVASLTANGFKELSESEYNLFVERLCISCADDDMRGYPETLEKGKEDGDATLGQKAVQVLLANTELKNCKTLELMLPPSDIIQTIEILSENKSVLGIETLVLKAAFSSDKNAPNEQCSENGQFDCCNTECDEGEAHYNDLPCDCVAAAFPKIKRLILIGGCWNLKGEQLESLEELKAGEMLTPSLRLDKLKKLKYERSLFYSSIESDGDFKPLFPAALLAARCPKLQVFDFDADGDIEILEDILTSPLIDRLTSLKIGTFDRSDLEKIYLLFTRFTDKLSRLENLTVALESGSLKKAEVDRLTAFPIPLNLEFE